jgi:UDP:flavonoid glycosyltransferase YjiC (YdhE family)
MVETRASPLVERITGWSARHKKTAVAGWLVLVAVVFVAGHALGVKSVPSYSPGQSGQAQRTLHQLTDATTSTPRAAPGFGSMAPGHGERLGELIAPAVARAGVRAVVQTGWAELNPSGDDLLAVGDLPHDWLLPRMAAVVHHAGAGTAGATLRAGIPAVAVPVMADQPFWAGRLHRLIRRHARSRSAA